MSPCRRFIGTNLMMMLRTPENNVVKCIKGKNDPTYQGKAKAGAPAKTNSIILNRREEKLIFP